MPCAGLPLLRSKGLGRLPALLGFQARSGSLVGQHLLLPRQLGLLRLFRQLPSSRLVSTLLLELGSISSCCLSSRLASRLSVSPKLGPVLAAELVEERHSPRREASERLVDDGMDGVASRVRLKYLLT